MHRDDTLAPDLCGARTKGGGRCGLRKGWGTGHVGVGRCKMHGGASPNAELAGSVELARREASVMGVPIPIDPHRALLKIIAVTNGELEYCTARIAELEAGQAAAPVVTEVDRPLKIDSGAESGYERAKEVRTGAPALHVWIAARHAAMDRLANYSAQAARAGVEARLVEMAEAEAVRLAQAFRAFVRGMGLDPTAAEVRTAMRTALMEVRGGDIEGEARPVQRLAGAQ